MLRSASGGLLPADEPAEPRAKKKDAAVLLDPRERVERWDEEGKRRRRLIRRVERAEAGRHPVLVER